MKALKVFAAVFILSCGTAFASDCVQGEALVTFRAPEGLEVSEASLENGEARKFIDGIAESCGAEVVRVYGTLSEASGGNIIAFLRSNSKTTQELILCLESSPHVIKASSNSRSRLMKTRRFN